MQVKRTRAAAAALVLLLLTGCTASSPSKGGPSPSPNEPSAAMTATQRPTSGRASESADGSDRTPPGPRWRPTQRTTWQWQLSGRLDLSAKAQIYDVDLFDTDIHDVRRMHTQGARGVCYFSAGSWEPGRPDSADFPMALRGKPLAGFEDERWLDIRRTDLLLPLMAKRLDLCRAKGFDGAEPDNVDGYANPSGFPLTGPHQLRYNRALAQLAHERGLAVALKNDLDQVSLLEPSFDFAVNEQCFEYDECRQLAPFVRAGKAVLHVEYNLPPTTFCPAARRLHFSSLLKQEDLGAHRLSC